MTPRDGLLDRLPRALHSLAEPPSGAAWNLPELSDLLPRGTPLRPAAVLVALVERDGRTLDVPVTPKLVALDGSTTPATGPVDHLQMADRIGIALQQRQIFIHDD